MKISVVTPLYKSGPYIEELCRRSIAAIRKTGADGYEIILVNDGSPDDSLAIAKALAAKDSNFVVIDLSRNFGQHPATLSGLAQVTGDYVFIMDSDLEEDPEWIFLFYNKLREMNCDVVYGINTNNKGGIGYSISRRIFYKILNLLSAVPFPENVCTARIMSRRYVDALMLFKERELFMAGIWHVAGFAQLPVEVIKVDSSPTTYSWARLVYVFVNAVSAFSTRPLLIISAFGIALSIVAGLFASWVIWEKIAFGIAVPGWASVMVATLFVGGLSMFFNGIIAIYVAKIFIEVKQRPTFIIREVFTSETRIDHRADGK